MGAMVAVVAACALYAFSRQFSQLSGQLFSQLFPIPINGSQTMRHTLSASSVTEIEALGTATAIAASRALAEAVAAAEAAAAAALAASLSSPVSRHHGNPLDAVVHWVKHGLFRRLDPHRHRHLAAQNLSASTVVLEVFAESGQHGAGGVKSWRHWVSAVKRWVGRCWGKTTGAGCRW